MFHEHKNNSRANSHLAKLVVVSFVGFPLLAHAVPEGDSASFGGGGFGAGGYYKSSMMAMSVDQTMRNDEESLLKRYVRYRALKSKVKEVKKPKVITLNEGLVYRRPVKISMAMER